MTQLSGLHSPLTYAGSRHTQVWLALDAQEPGGWAVEVRPGTHATWSGPIGAAILRRRYEAALERWRAEAHTWPCGQQDRYGDGLDALRVAIRACGYRAPLPR